MLRRTAAVTPVKAWSFGLRRSISEGPDCSLLQGLLLHVLVFDNLFIQQEIGIS
jgi:hypothetical protein